MFVVNVECSLRETDVMGCEGETKRGAGLGGEISGSPAPRYRPC